MSSRVDASAEWVLTRAPTTTSEQRPRRKVSPEDFYSGVSERDMFLLL